MLSRSVTRRAWPGSSSSQHSAQPGLPGGGKSNCSRSRTGAPPAAAILGAGGGAGEERRTAPRVGQKGQAGEADLELRESCGWDGRAACCRGAGAVRGAGSRYGRGAARGRVPGTRHPLESVGAALLAAPPGLSGAIPASSAAVWGPEEHRGLNAVLWGPCPALRAVPCRGGAVPGADAPRFVTRRSSFVVDNSAVGVAITTGGFLVVIF